MESVPVEIWSQLGISAIFLALFIYFHRNWSAERKEKDTWIAKMATDLMGAYSRAAELQTELKNAIDNNTQAVRELGRRTGSGDA